MAVAGGLLALTASAQDAPRSANGRRLTTAQGVVIHATPLRAFQILERRPAGLGPRVRFEWHQVRGAREFLLKGRWTGAVSWAMKTGAYAVTPRNAVSWTASRVTFEARLPVGSHSWQLFAVIPPNDTVEIGDPSLLSFTVH